MRKLAQMPPDAAEGGRRVLWNMARESSTLLLVVIDGEDRIVYTNRTLPTCAQTTVAAILGRPLGECLALGDSPPTGEPLAERVPEDRMFSLRTLGREDPRRFHCSMARAPGLWTIVGEPRVGRPAHLTHLREVFEVDRLFSRMEGLSRRELEVLGLLAEGLSSKRIAQRLHVSPARWTTTAPGSRTSCKPMEPRT